MIKKINVCKKGIYDNLGIKLGVEVGTSLKFLFVAYPMFGSKFELVLALKFL